MSHRQILVTGATDGIGRETALELGRRGAFVWVHGRNPRKVEAVTRLVREVGGPGAEGLLADLSRLDEVRRLGREVEERAGRLDVLLHNAGIYPAERQVTADGNELTLQVNHLAPFLLTHALLPLLKRSAPARVVVVSSVAHRRGQLDLDDLDLERGFSTYGAYALSKLCNVLFTFELAERLKGTGITANCLHPGVIDTKLLRDGFGAQGAPTESGAATSVYLALSDEVAGVTGRYFNDCRPEEVAPSARDEEARRRLWEQSARRVGVDVA
jgi:NAD(P)-dependent dehydrogenase (short-subunit alcohol dehydrogenase family)